MRKPTRSGLRWGRSFGELEVGRTRLLGSWSTSFRNLALCASWIALTSPFVARAEQLPIKSYTTADGLAQNSINRIVRDSHGFLWFCTDEGLSRFDGYTFTNYGTEDGLPHRMVSDILETRSGQYWVATHGGLARFNPKGTPPFTAVLPADNERLAKATTSLRQASDGTLWVGTANGVYRLECAGNRCSLCAVDVGIGDSSPALRVVEDLVEDRGGTLWVATRNGLYRRTRAGKIAHYTKANGLPDHYLHALFEDSHGRLWIGSRHGGFFRLDGTDDRGPFRVAQQFIYTASDGQVTTWIYQMMETSDGTFWAGSDRGVLQLSPAGQVRAFSTRNGLTQHEITSLAQDSAGNLWLGTSSAGAMKVTRDGFFTYDERDGIVGVNAIFGDRDGGVYFRGYVLGTRRSSVFEGAKLDPFRSFDTYLPRFGRYDGEHFTWLIPEAIALTQIGWVGERVTLRARSGEWWIGTGVGLIRFPAVGFEQLRKAKPVAVYSMPQVYRLLEDSHGDIWISTAGAIASNLARWEHATGNIHAIEGFPTREPARCFGEDSAGNMWIGLGEGVARYRDGQLVLFSAKNGLPPGGVNDIHADRAGRLWLASSASGVVRVDNPGAVRPLFRRYGTAEGLSSHFAEVLTEDGSGRIYVGTGRGLDRLDPVTGRIRHFTTADGLASGRFLGAFYDRQGRLWFGTEKGLTRFVPRQEVAASAPEIFLSAVTVAGSRHPVSVLGERAISVPDLSANRNQVQFDFVALNFALGQTLRYQYKLERSGGGEWSEPTEQRRINYANLGPGTYGFFVRALNSDGIASRIPATVTFRILPHVWQRWWFVLLAVAAAAAVVYAASRYRVQRLIEVANIRASIAADLHDDIGANLTRIAILSEVARRDVGNGGEEGPLPSIARISRESVAAMSDIVWAINPERDTLIDVVRRMRRHAEEVVAGNLTTLTFTAAGAGENLQMGAAVRRDLFLIFKEAVNNAVRHSRCSRLEIELRVEGARLLLRVSDDGTGFDPAAERLGQGVTGMLRRARKMGGELDIDSQPGRGTTVRLRLPYRASRWAPARKRSYMNTQVT